MTILVTGATGTIGSATVAALKKSGKPFKLGIRTPEKAKALGVDAVKFDWDDFSSYAPAFKGVEKLFLLTPISDRAFGYTLQAVAAAKRAGVKHVVKLSVVGADLEPGISLGRAHNAAEKEIKLSGLDWTMVRPTGFMQNFVTYFGANLKADSQVYLPYGDGKTSFVDAVDVGEVVAATLVGTGHAGKSYDLTGPQALGAQEILDIVGKALGHKYTYVDVPVEAARKAMDDMGSPLWLTEGFLELHALTKAGWMGGISEGVKQVLGRDARTFAQFAADLAKSQG